jgi:Ca2+-binding EF-hand superfamily protein
MDNLTNEQKEEFHEAFSLFDYKEEDKIETKDLGTVLRSLGIHTTDEEKILFIERFSKKGYINFQDFLEIVVAKTTETTPEEELLEAFKLFDNDKRGYISIKDFTGELGLFNEVIDDYNINDICEFVKLGNTQDKENRDDEFINFEEAVEKYMSVVKPFI